MEMFRGMKTMLFGLLCMLLIVMATAPVSAKRPPKPPPEPPPNPEYAVLDLGVTPSGERSRPLNNQGQVLRVTGTGPLVMDVDGVWVPVFPPGFDWLAWGAEVLSPELDEEQVVHGGWFWVSGISDGGVVAGGVCCWVSGISDPDDQSLWRDRMCSFICRPVLGGQGELVGYSEPENLGVCQEYPANTDCVLSTEVNGVNASGTLLGRSCVIDYTGGYNDAFPYYGDVFRIAPVEVDGQLVWFTDTDGDSINDLAELLDCDPVDNNDHLEAVDDVGRVYVRNGVLLPEWGENYVVLPDGTPALVGSSLDVLSVSAGNSNGLAVGGYKTDELHRVRGLWGRGWIEVPVHGPCMILGADTDGDGEPDTWFEDQGGDSRNDLIVPLGMLEGYVDGGRAVDVNDSGQIVGWCRSDKTRTGRALIWKDQAAVDLNTLIAEPDIVLTGADAITEGGVILCGGLNADGIGRLCLLIPIPPEE